MSEKTVLNGTYEILEKVGAGGMASVYRAHQPKLGRDVAIKVMHQTIANDEQFTSRFEREARIVASLDHPNIVPIYDYDEFEGQPYLVMKYVEGRTLKRVLRDGPMQPESVLRIIKSIGDALDYAHEKGVLHRDIKPSNILINDRGRPYLTDFGLARIARSGESTMSADVMLGTPHYISPEQARGNTDLDARTDVYSLGIVLYELVTGRVPFTGDTSYAIIHSQINTPPPVPHTLNPDVPDAVDAVLMKALAKDRNARYSSAGELVAAYEAAVASAAISAPRSQVAPRADTPVPPTAEDAGSAFDRFIRGVGNWGQHMEAQFSTFDEDTADMSESIKREEAKRRFKAAWQAARAGETARADEKRASQRSKFSPTMTVQVDTDDDDDDSGPDYNPALPPEENLRRRIEWRMNKRREAFQGWIAHLLSFIIITNVFCGFQSMWAQLMMGDFSTQPGHIFIYLWSIGLIVHSFDVWGSYGPGYMRRQRAIEREVQRQLGTYDAGKLKNEELRLTEDGELSASFLDELEGKRNRRS